MEKQAVCRARRCLDAARRPRAAAGGGQRSPAVARAARAGEPAGMPELPDVAVYLEALERRILGAELQTLRVHTPFLLRSVDPAPAVFEGRRVTALRRLGKRLVFAYDGELFSVIHLMIAGRLHWADADRKPPGRKPLLEFQFSTGRLTLTEAGSKRRASLHL